MRVPAISAIVFLAAALSLSIPRAGAQQPTQPPPAAAPSSADLKDKPKTHDQAVSAGDQGPARKPSTADDNPFPEDVSKKAAADAKADAVAAPIPAVKDSPGSSSLDGLDKLGLDDPSRKQLKVESPDGMASEYDPKRASEDVKIGQFYLKSGDYKGALARFQDAVFYDHENAEAVFWLAEADRKLNRSTEAIQNYQVYLDAVPDGPNAKPARKALSQLSKP